MTCHFCHREALSDDGLCLTHEIRHDRMASLDDMVVMNKAGKEIYITKDQIDAFLKLLE